MSISPAAFSIAPTAARSVTGTSWIASSGSPASTTPATIAAWIARLVRIASEPPRRITALPDISAERAGIGGDVGPALVDDADDAERHAHAASFMPLGRVRLVDDRADRIGQRGDRLDAPATPSSRFGIEPQPIEQRRRQAVGGAGGHVLGVGGEDRGFGGAQVARGGVERGGLGRRSAWSARMRAAARARAPMSAIRAVASSGAAGARARRAVSVMAGASSRKCARASSAADVRSGPGADVRYRRQKTGLGRRIARILGLDVDFIRQRPGGDEPEAAILRSVIE